MAWWAGFRRNTFCNSKESTEEILKRGCIIPRVIRLSRGTNMKLQFKDTNVSLGTLLEQTSESIKGKTISLGELLEMIGEQGLLLFCIILTLPFMLPVSIPGVSTLFGAVNILIGIGITMNRIPWLPERLMQRTIEDKQLLPVLEKGVELFSKVESFLKPRLTVLSEGALMNTVNGLVLTFAGILLIFPFGLIPFSNTLPALAILLLAVMAFSSSVAIS
jgi:hypothetical protein